MILVLLPGLDGTGKLFEPFIAMFSSKYTVQAIAYPEDMHDDYDMYIAFVKTQLPREEEYVLIAESFSGYIAYKIAVDKPKNLKQVVFVATFLTNPRPFLSVFVPIVPLKWLLSLPLPTSAINIL